MLAAHAASAIIASRHGEQLEAALNTRDTIGQAKGVIMERFNVDAVRAFDMLRELSQTTNTRLDRHRPARHRNPRQVVGGPDLDDPGRDDAEGLRVQRADVVMAVGAGI